MKIDKDKLKESLTEEEIIEILEYIGCDNHKIHKNYIAFSTNVCHSGSHLNLIYYDESKSFHCFSECNCTYDIYALVQKVKDTTFIEAIKFVSDFTNKIYELEEIDKKDLVDDWEWIKKLKHKNKRQYEENKSLSELILNQYIHFPHKKWVDDNISTNIQIKWGVFYDLRTDRICYPIYSENQQLVGVKGRVVDDKVEPKYLFLYPCNKSSLLVGLHKNLPTILEKEKILVFESFKSVMLADQYGYGYGVSIEGGMVSDWQYNKLLQLGVEVIIALDKGVDRKYLKELMKKFKGKTELSFIYDSWDLLNDKDAPVDQGKSVFDKLFQKKYRIR